MKIANFRYQPLADADDQIRLVSIIPKSGKKRLHLKLESVSLHDVRNCYEAVSYMWGDRDRVRHVTVNGQQFQLHNNIWQCLKHLRDHDLTTSQLWVDSICINQQDEREKSRQVARMSDIFARASRVLTWLGSTSLMQYPPSSNTGPAEESIATRPLADLDSWLGSPGPLSYYLMDQAMSIVYNPYWTRLWIVPEVIRAQDLQIVFGKDLIDPIRAGRICLVAREYSKPGYRSWFEKQRDPSFTWSGTAILDAQPMIANQSHRDGNANLSKSTLTELISRYSRQACCDPRDFVFALMGLCDASPHPKINYNLTHVELAVQILHYLRPKILVSMTSRISFLQSAFHLLQRLEVTHLDYNVFENALPAVHASELRERSFEIPLIPLSPVEWKHSAQHGSISSGGATDRHVMLLDGEITTCHPVKFEEMNEFDELLVLSSTGVSYGTIIGTWSLVGDMMTTEFRHLLRVDTPPIPDEPLPDLEIRCSGTLRAALEREVRSVGVDWDNLLGDRPATAQLRLSTAELIELCEVLSPQKWTIDPIGPRKVFVHNTGVAVAHYDELRRVLGPRRFLTRVHTSNGERWG